MKSRTLVIDDDPVMRVFISQALTKQGHAVLLAEDGQKGIDLMRDERPGLVLCDIHMEGVNGFKALEALRADPSTATVPFILMTGSPEAGGMRRGMSLGADDYLSKPFSVPELLAAVEAQEKKRELLLKQEERRLKDLRTSLSLALPHEFFTPLNAIMGYAELMQSMARSITPGEIEEMTRTIMRSGERLHKLIKNYIVYAQFEMFSCDTAKVASLRAARCPGSEETIREAARAAAIATKRQPNLKLQLAPATLRIDSEYLAHIVEALTENGFKFSEPGQPVEVGGHPDTSLSRYELAFSDLGRGMTEEQIRRVGAFLQFDRKKHEQQGMGLGLAIARRIAEVHGGSLKIQSSLAGTTVTVTLPCE
jgi:signal transduction histidine kinase